MLIEALEAGGTKMVCAVGKEDGAILERVSIPTTTPEGIIPKLIEHFQDKGTEALDVAASSPVDVKPGSETCEYILDTPKLTWRRNSFLDRLKDEPKVPMRLDTDVSSPYLGEVTYGCARGLDSVIYITIGAGVGVSVCISGTLLYGMLHPEGGHILLVHRENDPTGGICPYHKNCLEDFASSPPIEARWDKKAVELVDRPKVWEMESYYIAQALMDCIVLLSPRKIILDGGVMRQEQLFPMTHQKVREVLNGYVKTKELEDMDSYIVPVNLHDDQRIMGCIKLGLNALRA